jgi:hypothetical protein
MFAKKEFAAPPAPVPAYRQELDHLYARRSAIDSLIESLEEYERFKTIQQQQYNLRPV